MTHHEMVQSGLRLQNDGKVLEAADLYRQVLQRDPDHTEALHCMGLLALRNGSLQVAVDLLTRAARRTRGNVEVYLDLADTWLAMKRADEAERCCAKAVRERPEDAGARLKLAEVLIARGDLRGAEAAVRWVVARRGEDVEALNHLAYVLVERGMAGEAVEVCRRVCAIRPASAIATKNLGGALNRCGKFGEAVEAFERAVGLDSSYFEGWIELGQGLRRVGRLAESVGAFERAAEVAPDRPEAKYLMAFPLLLGGDYGRGWEMYEWRWKCKPFAEIAETRTKPRWTGEDPRGKTILLFAEQGLGDGIQFVRYAPMLAERGARMILACSPALRGLLGRLPNVETIVSRDLPLPRADYRVPLMSLPHILGTTVETIPREVPYLRADEEKVRQWAEKLGERTGVRVGIAWSGNPKHEEDRWRSVPAGMLARLGKIEGVEWHSLQKFSGGAEAPTGFEPRQWVLGDFAETAGLVANLDLVISVDTAVAHLAGAMGKPTWVMLPYAPDWRWMLGRADSPWYPTMRLFRQDEPGEWAGVVGQIAEELRTTAGGSPG